MNGSSCVPLTGLRLYSPAGRLVRRRSFRDLPTGFCIVATVSTGTALLTGSLEIIDRMSDIWTNFRWTQCRLFLSVLVYDVHVFHFPTFSTFILFSTSALFYLVQ